MRTEKEIKEYEVAESEVEKQLRDGANFVGIKLLCEKESNIFANLVKLFLCLI